MRVRLELGLAFYLKQEDALAREHFERALVGKPPEALVSNIKPVFEDHAGTAPLDRVFRVLPGPGHQYQRRVGCGGHLYQRPAVPPGGGAAGEFGYRRGGLGRRLNTSIPLANRWRLRSGFNVNHREYKGGRFDQTFLAGSHRAALAD